MTPELDDFQHETLAFFDAAHGRAVLADPMGARKTGTVLAWLAQKGSDLTLVVAPTAVHGHWEREAARFFPDAHVIRLSGMSKPKRIDAIDAAAEDSGQKPQLLLTSYDGSKADQFHLLKHKPTAVVYDEGHRLKGRTTDVALTGNKLAKVKHLLICTGTPVLNHASELWQYLHMMAPTVYPAFWVWCEEHFIVKEHRFRNARWPTKLILGYKPGHEEIVRNQIMPWFIQRDIAELFPNEPWVVEPEHVEVAVDLSPAEQREYDRLVKYKWARIEGVEWTTANSVALTTRLNQLSSEWGTLGATELGTKVKTAVELIADLLERDEGVVVFAKYKGTVDRLVEALGKRKIKAAAYHGDIPVDRREEAVANFADGTIDVIVGTLDSMAEGVDGLQARCSLMVMVDRYWTAAKNDQAFGRLRRSGQVRKVTVYHVFANHTIDDAVVEACLRKTNVVESLRGRPLSTIVYGRST